MAGKVGHATPKYISEGLVDPTVREARSKMWDYYYKLDEAGADAVHRELMKYVLEQAWAIPPYPGWLQHGLLVAMDQELRR